MSTAQRLIKNTGYLYVKIFVVTILSLITTRITLNALGVTDFGIFSIIGGAIAMLGFLNGSMVTVTKRYMNFYEGEGNDEKKKQVFNVGVVIHGGLSLFAGILLIVAAPFLFNGILTLPGDRILAGEIIYGCLVVSTFFTIWTVPYDAAINAHENMFFYSIVGVTEASLKCLISYIILYYHGDKLVLYGILMSLIPIITWIILWKYCSSRYNECRVSVKRYWNYALFKDELSYACWNMCTSVTVVATKYGIGVLLNHFFGVVVNAAQGVANQVSGFTSSFSGNAMRALAPVIVKSEGKKDRKMLIYTSLLGCRATFFLFGFFAIPLILEMPLVLELWLKNVPEWAVVFCRLQLVYILFEQLINGVAKSIYAHGQIKNYAIRKGLANITPLLLCYILFFLGFPPHSNYYVLIICGIIIGGALVLFYAHKYIGLSYAQYFRKVIFPSLIVVSASLAIYVVVMITGIPYIRYVAIGLQMISFVVLGYLCLFEKEERSAVKTLVFRILKLNKEINV